MAAKAYTYVIIGAGPTGLGAAHRLQQLGEQDFIILDRNEKAGGLASSFVDDKGFTWDIGGHVQFSHYKPFDELMAQVIPPEGWLEHKRSAWAWLLKRFVPYPVQNNLRHFPSDTVWECIQGIMALTPDAKPKNFHEWILATFGEGLAKLFMVPYNFKVWAHGPERMSYQWIGERVAVTSLEKALKNVILKVDDVVWGPNSMFRFPSKGGTGGIWEKTASLIGHDKFAFNCDVREIDYKKKEILCKDGARYRYQHLISTMPLNVLCHLLRPQMDKAALIDADALLYSSSNIVGLGLTGQCPEHLKNKSWIYFPESDCPFYRTTVFSNYSPQNVPDASRYWSLMTETSESADKPVNVAALAEETIQGCLNTGLIASRDQVCSVWQYRAPHGYPVPSLERDAILSRLIPLLDGIGVYSRGRFGGWKYEVSNQDHSMMQGVEIVNLLVNGEKERVYPFAWMGQ